ncbi:hypothetical protein ADK38_12990, partial [Streptomyces varsoviensis]
MVGDLDDIHRRQLRVRRQQGLLRGRFEVPQQQRGQPARTDEECDARVIGPLLDGRPRGPGRRRGPQHLPRQAADVPP